VLHSEYIYPCGIESSIKQSVELLHSAFLFISLFFGFRNIAASAGLRVSALTAEIIIAMQGLHQTVYKKRPKIRK